MQAAITRFAARLLAITVSIAALLWLLAPPAYSVDAETARDVVRCMERV